MAKTVKKGKKKIILYTGNQFKVGGIETFNNNFCKRLSKYYDIIFLYDEGDESNLEHLKPYVELQRFEGQTIYADIVIYSSAWGKRPEDFLIADRYIQMIHADYTGIQKYWNFKFVKTPKTKEFIAGGDNIARVFRELYKHDTKVIHYLLEEKPKVEPVLHLITLSRIGVEKGFERISKMAHLMKLAGKKFVWLIYGYAYNEAYGAKIKAMLADIPEVVFLGLGRNLTSYVADADYLVQLSDTEGYSFSIAEALQVGTPCILTDFPNAREQVTDGVNGYILDMNLKNLTNDKIDLIFKKIKKPVKSSTRESTEQDWIDYLGDEPTKVTKKTKYPPVEYVNVAIIRRYMDLQLKRNVARGEVLNVTKQRASELISKRIAING